MYLVKEVFFTLQGEGFHVGTPAVFCRFAGCNVWSGRRENRERDTARGGCAAWCDTDFVGGDRYADAEQLAATIVAAAGGGWFQGTWVVFTGGEPGLQLDQALVDAVRAAGGRVAVETNGSVELPNVDWVCCSPKPPMPVVLKRADEVKVVFPAFDPRPFAYLAPIRWVQPQDPTALPHGTLRLWNENTRAAVEFAQANLGWRVGVQAHKMMGLR